MGTSKEYVFESQGHRPSLTDLVKANVLIDGAKRARLADFGLLTIISDTTNLISSTSFTQGGTHRWMGPELFDPENFGVKDSRPTKNSDCYAVGMLIYEVLSGQIPFSRHRGPAVVVRIFRGERPERPQGADGTWFTNEVWGTLERCWNPTPCDRPAIEDVLQCLDNASGSWTLPSSQMVASQPATGPPTLVFDSSAEESTDELQEVSSRPVRKHPKGDLNENHT